MGSSTLHEAVAIAGRAALLGLLLALPLARAQAVDPEHLIGMPSAERVRQEIRGRDARDTAARQVGAYRQLDTFIRHLAGPDRRILGNFTADESRLLADYGAAADAVRIAYERQLIAGLQGRDDEAVRRERLRWFEQYSTYGMDEGAFRAEVLERLFSPALRTLIRNALDEARGPATRPGDPADDSGASLPPPTGQDVPGSFGEALKLLFGSFAAARQTLWSLLTLLAIPAGLLAYLAYRIRNLRYFAIRRGNRAAIEAFGSAEPSTREQAIIEAFDSPDHTFSYTGTNRTPGHKLRFTLLRNIKSFNRGDLEALRFAYLAFNRGLISEEQFHWFRFSAIYAGGLTDPSEWRFLGLAGLLGTNRGKIEQVRAAIANFASGNGGPDVESPALALIQKLAVEHPQEALLRDIRRRFIEGGYWLTQGELKRSAFAPSDTPYGISFGTLDGTDTELVYAGEGSIMTIAPPRSGKTQCNVFPNLLRWPGPAFVLDIKGEIFAHTSAWRAANVGPVIRFAPLDPAGSACYNPLTLVRRESIYLWEDARFLASMMIVPNPASKEPFWEEKAREILTAVIADVAFWNLPDKRPMAKVLSIVNRNGWSEFVDRLRKNPEVQTMRDEGSNLAQMDPRTLDGALQTAKASLSAWVGERIAQVTRQSDWSPADLRSGRNPTIYLCIMPNEIEAYLSLLRVLIAQHVRTLVASGLPPRGAAPILFVLDEFPQLRQMQPIEEALNVGAGYGLRLWMFAQNLAQLKTAYPTSWDGMIGSCAVRSFMNPSLQDGSAQMVSEQIGYRRGEEHGGKDAFVANANPRFVVEPTLLAGADYKELQIVLGTGSKPAKVRKRYAHADPALAAKMALAPPTGR